MILPVIMAGGSGSRLWPLSRQMFPKQFLTLQGDHSMLQATALRLSGLEHQPSLVICNEEHRFSVAEQFREKGIPNGGIILEPVGRNTAPAIALAALKALQDDTDPLLLVLAADHVIKNESAFCSAVKQAIPYADAGKLVTFGIVPTSAETGYGYIKRGSEVSAGAEGEKSAFTVASFVEKPNIETAERYLASKDYYWNSGMFLFRASRYLQELSEFRPDIYEACKNAIGCLQSDLDFIRVNKAVFETCPDDSIDYAVMEKTKSSVVVPMDCGWSDVGSWSALWEIEEKDTSGNVFHGDVMSIDTQNSYVHANEKLVAILGLEDIVVVETKDAVLISNQAHVQQIKSIVDSLKTENRREWQHHREVYRPWGKYDCVDASERFMVKRITVKPGARVSVQLHHHRSEHWIVVSGMAKVINGDKEFLLNENQSTYIPAGVIHALENPGQTPLEVIEVQSGDYLGEDDIVRFKDKNDGGKHGV